MGAWVSKEKQLLEHVNEGNVDVIKHLHCLGVNLNFVDGKGRTPLILASMMPNGLHVVKVLLELGAHVDTCPGLHGGTALHHAARGGLKSTIDLLLSHGGNPLRANDNGLTVLDVAKGWGHFHVVCQIENRISLFSGWLRASYGQRVVETMVPRSYKKVLAFVLPCDTDSYPFSASKVQLVLYSNWKALVPIATVALWDAGIQSPDYDHPDPAVVVFDKHIEEQYLLLSETQGDKALRRRFFDACRGNCSLSQHSNRLTEASGTNTPAAHHEIHTGGGTTACSFSQDDSHAVPAPAPAPLPVEPSVPPLPGVSENCVVCMDAAIEGACVPCGHYAGCLACLNEIKAKNLGCPICRTKIDQVIKLYTVC